MAQKRVTIQDVANQAGVSITTVSRYLNQRYESMSVATKNRIGDVIATLQYRPNALARGLKSNQSGMVAVIVVNISYPYCVSLIRTLSNALSPAGYSVLVCETGGDVNREAQIVASLMSRQVDAMIIQTDGDNNDVLAEVARQVPIVLVDRNFHVPGTSCIVTNNHDASYDLTRYLFEQGYQSILYVTEPEGQISTRMERKAGYQDACFTSAKKPWIEFVDRQKPQTFVELVRTVRSRNMLDPFAVYTANGLLMMELYRALQVLLLETNVFKLHMGLATFDEPDWVSIVTPSLTCVRQPVEKTGELAARIVLQQMKHQEHGKRTRKLQVIASMLVVGQSTQLNSPRFC